MGDDAIIVDSVSKVFTINASAAGSVKSVFTSLFGSRQNKDRDKQQALTDVSFTVKSGEFFGVVGRNGSGKSTLLKIMAGIYQSTSGGVKTTGKVVPFIELGVGFNPELTGEENVYLSAALLGFSRTETAAMYNEIVEFAELEPHMQKKLKNYSSGMQVRLAFSIATRVEGDILLIDEVLAVGDADFQRKCFQYFKQLKKQKRTVIFVSHDVGAVREYCDRAVLIEDSKVQLIDDASEVADTYLSLFQGSAQIDNELLKDVVERWGDKKAITKSISVEVKHDSISITQEVECKTESFEFPVVGFRVRDEAGTELFGTNNKIEKQPIKMLGKGEKKKLIWTFPNILKNGRYSIDPAVVHDDITTVSDWWNDALFFTVVGRQESTPYPVAPTFKVSISK